MKLSLPSYPRGCLHRFPTNICVHLCKVSEHHNITVKKLKFNVMKCLHNYAGNQTINLFITNYIYNLIH